MAVALGYDIDVDNAPKVVAKGEGVVAEKIIEIALANGIKVRRDADLATVLSALEIDAEIPYEAFTAVAEILSYVYQANDRIRRQTAGKKGNGETA
ncbi:MAG: EscU/YscU/HrcU family type III secretion system export apparatus switch protein [Alphaproteobacteria bacterium]|nr:EscU/YscU/HrcU family type III secretion system export apparatus switch protein [Alphaproteobacteria bacterium]